MLSLAEKTPFEREFAERPTQQKTVVQSTTKIRVLLPEPSEIQAWEDLEPSSEWVYAYNDSGWTPLIGLTGRPAALVDLAKSSLLDEAASLSASLVKRVKELTELSENWDGDHAKPIDWNVLNDVVRFLKWLGEQQHFVEPFIVPTFNGLLQIEWHGEKRLLEIEGVKEGWVVGGTIIHDDSRRDYFEGQCSKEEFGKLRKSYDWFSGVEEVWPFPEK